MRFLDGIEPGGKILDVACGNGRHIAAALQAGFSVTGVDRNLSTILSADKDSPNNLAAHANLRLVSCDLEANPADARCGHVFETGQYDGIIVTNYLWRPLFAPLIAALKPQGVLIYETFALGNERFGKPRNQNFLLKPGELISAFSPALTPIAYEHITATAQSDGQQHSRVVQRICAVGPAHKWLTTPPTLSP